MKFANG
jgi:hypothetical protein